MSEIYDEARAWLDANWDPDLSVGEWWEQLCDARWAVPMWPEDAFGRGHSRSDATLVSRAIRDAGALPAPGGLGIMLAGPTIVAHGTDEQKAEFLRPIVSGQEAWCQLFSEPEAGSDLAGLQCKAMRDGDEWVVNGQKVWTSGGQIADRGMLLARTDPDVPKHRGISWFAIDMHQTGMDVRPLTEMTGRALFNEVFISDCRVLDAHLVGGLNNGWAVGNTTLMVERATLGAGPHAAAAAMPGTVAGQLERRAGDFVSGGASASEGVIAGGAGPIAMRIARQHAPITDPVLRQKIVRLHILGEIQRMSSLRAKAARAAGVKLTGAEPNIAKLTMSEVTRLAADVALAVQGPAGTLLRDPACDPAGAELALFAPAVSIYGGTDQVQRNIIGERILQLPSEPRVDKDVPFRELRTSARP